VNLFFNRKLAGIAAIANYLGVRNPTWIHELMVHYELPVRRERDGVVATKRDLRKWLRKYHNIKEPLPAPRICDEYRLVPTRFGLFKLEKRRIFHNLD
jgi:hypothetical protein